MTVISFGLAVIFIRLSGAVVLRVPKKENNIQTSFWREGCRLDLFDCIGHARATPGGIFEDGLVFSMLSCWASLERWIAIGSANWLV